MLDGLLIVTDHDPQLTLLLRLHPIYTRNIAHYEWSQVTSIDLRANPVRVVLAGTSILIDGTSEDKRAEFYRELTDARVAGTIPASLVVAGADKPATKKKEGWLSRVGGWILFAFIAFAIWSYYHESAAKCKITSVHINPDIFIINGEADAGYTVLVVLGNSGKQGPIKVKAWIDTSEGKFTREQEYTLNENSSRELSFGFPEPTINATNVQSWASCSP